MPILGMYLTDVMLVRQYLDEIDAISAKYNSNREDIIAMAERIENIKINENI